MKVYVNDKKGKRKSVKAELVKRNKKTVWVKLLDGNIIKRKTEEVGDEYRNK